nr:N,N-dimethylformamidase beta subunit family domain-containing protein [Tetrasphaera sp. HKS02]
MSGPRFKRFRVGRALAATLAAAALAFAPLQVLLADTAAAAGPCGPPVVNVIACENTLQGDPASDWQITGSGSTTIQGFATSMSVNPGDTVQFKIKTPSTGYHFDILRLGYYQGNGARKVASGLHPTAVLPQTQPNCLNDTNPTGLIDCGNWGVSASWTVPTTAVSGVYIAHLVRDDTAGASQIVFIVRNDASHSDVLFQTDDETWQAYNTYGGNSLYSCTINCPAGESAGLQGCGEGLVQPTVPQRRRRLGPQLVDVCRVPDDPVHGGERLRRLLHDGHGCRHGIRRSPADQPQDVHDRRPRRVLVGPATHQRRGSARRRGEPRLLHG